MKKVLALVSVISPVLMLPAKVLAAGESIKVKVKPEHGVNLGAQDLGTVIQNVLNIIFVISALAVLFMLLYGAFQWITSGGEKEAVAKARGRITHALIGLTVLALSYFIVRVAGSIVGIDVLGDFTLPWLGEPSSGTTTTSTAPGRFGR